MALNVPEGKIIFRIGTEGGFPIKSKRPWLRAQTFRVMKILQLIFVFVFIAGLERENWNPREGLVEQNPKACKKN